MTNRKQIIQIVVIVIAFGASGFVLYNGFFKGSGQSAAPEAITSAQAIPGFGSASSTAFQIAGNGSQTILPAGDHLDFSILKSQNLTPQNISYPQLNPASDVGIPEQNLITPASAPSQ